LESVQPILLPSTVTGSCYRRDTGQWHFTPCLRRSVSLSLTRSEGDTGAVTLIQRFGSALNLNIHFHMLCLDGAFLTGTDPPVFRRIAPPTRQELQALVERIADRIGRALERRGLIERDCEN